MKCASLERTADVSALGLGCMGMTGVYGSERSERLRPVHAHRPGINLIVTSDAYGPAPTGSGRPRDPWRREQVLVATQVRNLAWAAS